MSAPPTDPLAALTAQVAQNVTVEGSAITLIQGLASAITAAGTNPVALAAIVTSLNTSETALATAILANTPAAPASAPTGAMRGRGPGQPPAKK